MQIAECLLTYITVKMKKYSLDGFWILQLGKAQKLYSRSVFETPYRKVLNLHLESLNNGGLQK